MNVGLATLTPTLKTIYEELDKDRRLVIVNPAQEDSVRAALSDVGYVGLVDVRGNDAVKVGSAIVINPRALYGLI